MNDYFLWPDDNFEISKNDVRVHAKHATSVARTVYLGNKQKEDAKKKTEKMENPPKVRDPEGEMKNPLKGEDTEREMENPLKEKDSVQELETKDQAEDQEEDILDIQEESDDDGELLHDD